MQTNANANHQVRNSVSADLVPLTRPSGRKNENSTEATMNPRMNFGKRSQMMLGLGCWPPFAPAL